MNLPKLWVIGLAVIAAIVVGTAGMFLLQPPGDLIQNAGFSESRITPNADGDTDIAVFSYTLSRNAKVTLEFTGADGSRYVFRDQERRIKGDYSVLFSGIVDGFRLPDEPGFTLDGEPTDPNLPVLKKRLIPNGVYTWTLTAIDDQGETKAASGTLEIAEGDSELPLIQSFDLAPTVFTPNQDGIYDRISVNIFLSKPVDFLNVYLLGEGDAPIYLPRREGVTEAGDAGNHEYDYDGGVDQGFRPPEDGEYTVFAVAQDAEGQRMEQTRQVTIEDSGLPQVVILPQATGSTVCFETAPYQDDYFSDQETEGEKIEQPTIVCSELTNLVIPLGDLLIFRLTVRNDGETPIRTAGPFPGTVYDYNQNRASLGYLEEAGVFRIGIHCATAITDFPWRWALAPKEELTEVYDEVNDAYLYYLEPGQRAEVWGAVRLTEINDAQNPQECWAGLIHERVATLQNRVGAREIELVQVD